jgi:hypothetical protein
MKKEVQIEDIKRIFCFATLNVFFNRITGFCLVDAVSPPFFEPDFVSLRSTIFRPDYRIFGLTGFFR